MDSVVFLSGTTRGATLEGIGRSIASSFEAYGLKCIEMKTGKVKWEGEQIGLEGCLSIPGYVGEVKRYMQVVARGLNRNGKSVKIKGDALLARAIQHEIDHLDGILFTDRLTSLDTLRKVEAEEQEKEAELVGA